MGSYFLKIHISVIYSIFVFIALISSSANAQTQIINIDATLDNKSKPIKVFLEKGIYSVEPIGIVDGGTFNAWNPWSKTTCQDPAGCQVTEPIEYQWLG